MLQKPSHVTVEVLLDKRRAKANGSFPVKLRITYQRIQQYYKLKIESDEATWEEVLAGRRSQKHNTIRDASNDVKARVNQILRDFEVKDLPFDFKLFEQTFFGDSLKSVKDNEKAQDLAAAFKQHINQLEVEGRASTATSYTNAMQSLVKYQPGVQLREVTPTWLTLYEQYMLAEEKSISTVGIYIRSLRTILNQALEAGVLTEKQYPFGKKKYQIPVGRNVKKALTKAEITQIRQYPVPAGSSEERAKDMWLFSYFCNGMNMKDIIHLRWENVNSEKITFNRQKTVRTNRANPRVVEAIITAPIQDIIDRWGTVDRKPNSLVFPFVPLGLSAKQDDLRARDFIKQVNKYMKRIGTSLGIDKPLTTYVARHSFATVLKRSGASAEYISESLGHSNLQTTQSYLDSFDDTVKRGFAEALL